MVYVLQKRRSVKTRHLLDSDIGRFLRGLDRPHRRDHYQAPVVPIKTERLNKMRTSRSAFCLLKTAVCKVVPCASLLDKTPCQAAARARKLFSKPPCARSFPISHLSNCALASGFALPPLPLRRRGGGIWRGFSAICVRIFRRTAAPLPACCLQTQKCDPYKAAARGKNIPVLA